ncbi:MAG: threonylcarbamoyl-AMP synthase [Clostridiales Family XIII bacterium]|jgi:L-threonylcarbamoyladenylate synthase|nr:threonylcarbamoyl-AMP synthase [Clostridiales Family XIII bacterium]
MNTKIFDITALNEETIRKAQVLCEAKAIADVEAAMARVREAAAILAGGGLVAFPTETVYGLGANALDEDAVRRVYAAKGRPADNPMIVHIARASDIGRLTDGITPDAIRLADRFWPGPLTMIFAKSAAVPAVVTGGLDTVAVRLPDCPAAEELIRLAGVPVAAPSANTSGRPSPTKAEHVIRDLDGKVDCILAGGGCRVGIESTVVDLTSETPTVLRPGIISAYDLSIVLGKDVVYDAALIDAARRDAAEAYEAGDDNAAVLPAGNADTVPAPRSPGMKYRHYAPTAEMILIEGSPENIRREAERLKTMNEQLGRMVGVILYGSENAGSGAANAEEAAASYYARLRELDDSDADLIIAGAIPDTDGAGFALMNRMRKSAAGKLIYV